MSDRGTGGLPSSGPALDVTQFKRPDFALEAGPVDSTGSRGTAPVDDLDHLGGQAFGVYGNDNFNDCVPVAIANHARATSGYYSGEQVEITIDQVYDLYRRSGNPSFVPVVGAPVQDNGCIVGDCLQEALTNGIGPYKPLAFAKVDVTNDDELKAAIQIFGGLVYLFNIDQAQDDQAFALQDWTLVPGSPSKGGHAVMAGGYQNPTTQRFITWGSEIGCDSTFRRARLVEAWAIIWPWSLDHPAFVAGVDFDALAASYQALTGHALNDGSNTATPSSFIATRWKSMNHVGKAKPRARVVVRRGHFHRRYSEDTVWEAVWVPDTDWRVLPNINQITVEQDFENNGVTVCTVQMDNIAYVEKNQGHGLFHQIERGWFSPLRSYVAPGRPGLNHKPNVWDRLLTDAVQIHVSQGYGDTITPTFTGLIDSSTLGDNPDKITLSCRDFGLNLVDGKLFGWNIDPNLRDPLHFYDGNKVRDLIAKNDQASLDLAAMYLKKWVIIDDVSEMVSTVCRWGGWDVNNMHIEKTGARLSQAVAFSYSDTLMTVIQKACDLTGFVFYIEPASKKYTRGRPIFKPSNASIAQPPIRTEIRDDQILTGVSWATDNTQKASIIRVRGKEEPRDRGGISLGGDKSTRITGVYRPPWHAQIQYGAVQGVDRDARVLRHEIHSEPLYTTDQECLVACQMIALAQALSATTSTIELPGYPLHLDDVLGLLDRPSGLNTRVWVAHTTSTQTFGQTGTYKLSLGLALLDNPDVVEVVKDLHQTLFNA